MHKFTPKITKILALAAVIILFSGCVVVINTGKPTADEQTLISLQTQASQEVTKISQKIQTGGYSIGQVQELITSAKKVIDDSIAKIDSLKISERTKALAQKTKDYLAQTAETYNALLQLSEQTGTKIQELISKFKTLSEPIINMATQVEKLKNEFVAEIQKASK